MGPVDGFVALVSVDPRIFLIKGYLDDMFFHRCHMSATKLLVQLFLKASPLFSRIIINKRLISTLEKTSFDPFSEVFPHFDNFSEFFPHDNLIRSFFRVLPSCPNSLQGSIKKYFCVISNMCRHNLHFFP